jgi:2-polyprenyl-6-methoxyphenol hydroxylase-like FAD-dependent oxidoreductase
MTNLADSCSADPASRDASVLVVGAGPTGLLLASELERRNVPCHLIDARPAPLKWDRATVVHPRTLQIFESMGIVDQVLEAGCFQRAVKIHSKGKLLGRLDLSSCGSIYEFNVGLSEEVTESILTGYLRRQGGDVTRSSKLVGLTHDDQGAVAEIERDGERYKIETRWVIGCDGIHSPTRTLCSIGFEGHDCAKPWAVFDATLQGWTDSYETTFVYFGTLPIIFTAIPGQRWRVYLRPSSEDSDLVADATFTLSQYVPEASFVDVANPARFYCQTKIASQYRSGSVFLAGDAAHLCSPSQGHGMNCGMQDAFNLAWKLALVYHGHADEALLDSYDAERRPAAQMVMQSGDEFENALTMTDPAECDARDEAIKAMIADPKERQHAIVAETELNIQYSQSPIIAGEGNCPLTPGRRLPDTIPLKQSNGHAARFHQLAQRAGHTLMLVAGPDAHASAFADLHAALKQFTTGSPFFEEAHAVSSRTDLPTETHHLEDHIAPDLFGIRETTLLALRPDGYIGLRADTDHLNALDHYRTLLQSASVSS